MANARVELSVILATRNNALVLNDLLRRLQECRQPTGWELIVVDNGSGDSTADTVHRYADVLPVRYLYEAKPGKSRALNRAIRSARGEIILFTDDDVIPDQDWLVNHLSTMREYPDVNVVGGRITVDKSRLPRWLTASYNLMGMVAAEHDLGEDVILYNEGACPYGPNMSVRKTCIDRSGALWPVHLGPGTNLPLGDEMVFLQRLSDTPGDRLYAPACVVEHKPLVGENYLAGAVRRCWMGGYAAGYYFLPAEGGKARRSIPDLVLSRIRSGSSWQEYCCVFSRTCGYYTGRLTRQVHGPDRDLPQVSDER